MTANRYLKQYFPQLLNIFNHGIMLENNKKLRTLNLIATTALPIYAHFNLTIVDQNGKSLNERAVQIIDVKGAHSQSDYYDEYDLQYGILSSLYYLNRLIDIYVKNTQLFEENYPTETTVRGNIHDPHIFYEVDAFLMASRRLYDSISKVIWKHYYPNQSGRWNSIRDMIKKIDKVPQPFADTIQESWDRTGVNVRNYRDCIIHGS